MTERQIAILVDGGFFLKRIPNLVRESDCNTPEGVAACMRRLCRNHVKLLTGDDESRWQRHVYRIFYYDAAPYDGAAHHPVENRQIAFGKSDLATFRNNLFDILRRQRNVALRLGKVIRDGDWSIVGPDSRKIIATKAWIDQLDLSTADQYGFVHLGEKQRIEAVRLQNLWRNIPSHNVRLPLKQKGVDMRIGLDIASIALKKQAQTVILVAGDSDFVPAAKLARREGLQFILDPMWQKVNADLFEHIDGLQSGLPNPNRQAPVTRAAAAEEQPEEPV